MKNPKLPTLATVSLGALLALAASPVLAQQSQQPSASSGSGSRSAYVPLKDTMEQADKDMKRVLEMHQKIAARPLEFLTPEQARQVPSPADAVKALLREQGKDPEALMAQMGVKKQDITYSGPAGDMPARVYTPENAGQGPLPIVVYFHGGGWVIADINTYEASAMALAKKANAIVVSAEYRHAPEHKFPAAHEDAIAAYSWVLTNAQSFNGDPTRVAVAGESAGGGLAAHVALASRQGRFQKPAHMLLVYPVAGTDMTTKSYQEHAIAKPLSKGLMGWFVEHTIKGPEDLKDPRLNLVEADLKDLPDATIIAAEIDPLTSEGKMLADKLKAAGVEVTYQLYEGAAHEFFGMDAVVADADKAQDLAARELKQAFAQSRTGSTRGGQQKKGD